MTTKNLLFELIDEHIAILALRLQASTDTNEIQKLSSKIDYFYEVKSLLEDNFKIDEVFDYDEDETEEEQQEEDLK